MGNERTRTIIILSLYNWKFVDIIAFGAKDTTYRINFKIKIHSGFGLTRIFYSGYWLIRVFCKNIYLVLRVSGVNIFKGVTGLV